MVVSAVRTANYGNLACCKSLIRKKKAGSAKQILRGLIRMATQVVDIRRKRRIVEAACYLGRKNSPAWRREELRELRLFD
jgi:hypothetical protein